MLTITPPTAVSKYSSGFETTKHGKVWVHLNSTFATGTVTMQKSIDRGTTWDSFYPDGTEETFTSETTKLYDLPGGWFWRFLNDGTAGASNSTVVYVDGHAVRNNVTDGN